MAKRIELQKYKDIQSFMHRKAVQVLAKWLRSIEASKAVCCQYGNLAWRRNQGIHTELKFHEYDSPFYFEHMPDNRGRILFVPDIVIFHQGYPKYIIEVVHKNPPTEKKLNRVKNFFKDLDTEVMVISAHYIMSQIRKPKTLNFNKAA